MRYTLLTTTTLLLLLLLLPGGTTSLLFKPTFPFISLFSSSSSSSITPDPFRPPPQPLPTTPSPPTTKEEEEEEYKYFIEPGTSESLTHYDARFFASVLPLGPLRTQALHSLIKSYLLTLTSLQVPTWLAHGTLLGWFWNGRIMPWDWDLDVQLSSSSLSQLSLSHNYTFWTLDGNMTREGEEGGRYLFDINPFYDRERGEGVNVIDARWVDTLTGLFVDITGVKERDETEGDGEGGEGKGVWSCKNWHRYHTREIWPLRETVFEGVKARVPWDFERVLAAEYGVKALVGMEWEGHRWDKGMKEWVRIPEPEETQMEKEWS
ncbi:mannosylphosphate transferase [Echria macrotheca]|uniref:Mannosylphosphate transferase n=1 Tax=Echria macrotheca TaxID=438768 RepID=A0AAJ0BAS9_9PEZI|nr:mannosylphosphate transferase [Echria macrotheca]